MPTYRWTIVFDAENDEAAADQVNNPGYGAREAFESIHDERLVENETDRRIE